MTIMNTLFIFTCYCLELIHLVAMEHEFPIPDCQTKGINLILISGLDRNTSFQTTRLKHVVSYFLPGETARPTRLRVSHYLPFHRKPVLHLRNITTQRDVNTTFDNLFLTNVSGGQRVVNGPLDMSAADTFLKKLLPGSKMNSSSETVVIWFLNCIFDIECDYNKITPLIKTSFPKSHRLLFIFTIRNVFFFLRRFRHVKNMVFVDENDDFSVSQNVQLSLCGKCGHGWSYHVRHNSLVSVASCYRVSIFPNNITWRKASNLCKAFASSLVSIETNEEFDFLKGIIQINISSIPHEDLVKAARHQLIHVGLQRNSANQLTWLSGRPLIFGSNWPQAGLKMTPRRVCLLWRYDMDNTLDPSDSWLDTECNSNVARLSLCEVENIKYEGDPDANLQRPSEEMYERLLKNPNFARDAKHVISISGNLSLNNDEISSRVTFDCGEFDQFVSYNFVCDNVMDCSNGRDEEHCYTSGTDDMINANSFVCQLTRARVDHYKVKIPVGFRCNFIEDCPDGSDEQDCDGCLETRCQDGSCLPRLWFSETSQNCTQKLADVTKDVRVQVLGLKSCSNLVGERECFPSVISFNDVILCEQFYESHQLLFPFPKSDSVTQPIIAPRCIYIRSRSGNSLGCPDMSHLLNCENHSCTEGFFKCPDSYCIPVYLLNDNIMDCPSGEDEDIDLSFDRHFKCLRFGYNLRTFLHPVHVCDGVRHCPSGDDELNCDVSCPPGFSCLDGVITARGYNKSLPQTSLSLFPSTAKYLNLSGIDISSVRENHQVDFADLFELRVSGCSIQDDANVFFKDKTYQTKLFMADFSHNKIRFLKASGVFGILRNLHFLNLSFNFDLNYIEAATFNHSGFIKSLDLSHTKITSVNTANLLNLKYFNVSFTQVSNISWLDRRAKLQNLDLRKTSINRFKITEDFFHGLIVTSSVYVDSSLLCCPQFRGPGISKHACHAPIDSLSTCEHLLGNYLKKFSFWLVALFVFVGNAALVGFNLWHGQSSLRTSYGVFLTLLYVSDLLMGIYLIIIISADFQYSGVYATYRNHWIRSHLCRFSGFIAVMAIATSPLFLLLLTLDRYVVIKSPFGANWFTPKTTYLASTAAWLVGISQAMIPFVSRHQKIYSYNNLCIKAPLDSCSENCFLYWKVVLWLQVFLFALIAAYQCAIVKLMSSKTIKLSVNATLMTRQRGQDVVLAKHCLCVFVGHLLFLGPIIGMDLWQIHGQRLKSHIPELIVNILFGLRACLNPSLYVVFLVWKNWREKLARKQHK